MRLLPVLEQGLVALFRLEVAQCCPLLDADGFDRGEVGHATDLADVRALDQRLVLRVIDPPMQSLLI